MEEKLSWQKVLFVLVIVNLLILDIFLIISGARKELIFKTTVEVQEQTSCPKLCSDEFSKLLNESLATFSSVPKTTPKPVPTSCPKCQTTTPIPQNKLTYIPLVSSASTIETNWVDIASSNFYFDLNDYPSAKSVHFDVHLKALHGSGRVYARLYDESNKRAVDFSEHSTQSPTFELLSSPPLSIWRGNNLYKVQVKSINGTEAFLEEAKLKILF